MIQLSKTVPDVKVFGVASKGKHEALQGSQVDHLLERGNDYVHEVRKCVFFYYLHLVIINIISLIVLKF